MRGLIYYYSSTGNTRLAVNYLKKYIGNAEFKICDIANDEVIMPNEYDIIGFAAFAEYLGPPTLMKKFIESLNMQNDKYAFVFNTFSGFTGQTKIEFTKQVEARGFKVIAGHALKMPMNYPPMKRNGKHLKNAPTMKDMSNLNEYINEIEKCIDRIKNGEEVKSLMGKFSLKKLIPSMPRNKVKKDFGIQQIHKDKCINCGKCTRVCAYNAIEMKPDPIVNHSKCNGCWACYNGCPKKAIQARDFTGEHEYKGPSKELIEKMK